MSVIFLANVSVSPNKQLNCEIAQTHPGQVVTSEISLKPLWAKMVEISPETTNSLVITDDLVVIAQSCGEIDAFDLSTGRIRWQLSNLSNPKNFVLDSNRQSIYISEVSSLRAISTLSGETLWVNNSPLFSHTANPSYLLTTGELIVDAVGNGFYYVDPVTGNMSDKISVPLGSIFYTKQVTFVKTPTALQALDNNTKLTLWTNNNLSGSWDIIPFETEQVVFIGQRYENITPTLIALDWNSGEVKWQIQDKKIVSNIVISSEKLFGLDDEDELLTLDINTGKQVNLTTFESQSTNQLLTPVNTVNGGQIALKGNIVAIYFEDSHLLSLYQLGSS